MHVWHSAYGIPAFERIVEESTFKKNHNIEHSIEELFYVPVILKRKMFCRNHVCPNDKHHTVFNIPICCVFSFLFQIFERFTHFRCTTKHSSTKYRNEKHIWYFGKLFENMCPSHSYCIILACNQNTLFFGPFLLDILSFATFFPLIKSNKLEFTKFDSV